MLDSRGFLETLIDDGRPLISLTGICLGLSGAFAIFQSVTGHFLPHDVAFLGMLPQDLCNINECRIVHFMFHDRVSFGGSLIAIAVVYLWLAAFPLKAGEPWAWWILLISGIAGFGSFLTYLGYGYLDNWHAMATLALLPCFVAGLWLTHRRVCVNARANGRRTSLRAVIYPNPEIRWLTQAGLGRICLLCAAVGLIGAGFMIQGIGMTEVFVPTDLAYMGLTRARIDAVNPRLIPLIAHDRAGFGGGVATSGLLLLGCLWYGGNSRSMWQGMLIGAIAGWGAGIGIHPIIGYNTTVHLAPAVIGAGLYFTGLLLLYPSWMRSRSPKNSNQ